MHSKINKRKDSRRKTLHKLLNEFEEDPVAEKMNTINEERLNRAINKVSGIKLKLIDTSVLIKKPRSK